MDEVLKRIKLTELDILTMIDKICRDNNLRYSLAYGTLLGAVRHGGFIPWDDDIDIIMPREDYEKFLKVWNETPPVGFIIQNKYTNSDFTQNFTKIRRDHTTFIQDESEKEVSYHTGIFVDIFPGDRAATGLAGKIQFMACAVNLLYARGFTSGSGGLMGLAERFLLKMPDSFRQKMYTITDKYIQKWNGCRDLPIFFPSTISEVKKRYHANMFEEMTELEFEGRYFLGISCYADMLTEDYGDYMKLPPVEQRKLTHHPILIDFEHNRDEL